MFNNYTYIYLYFLSQIWNNLVHYLCFIFTQLEKCISHDNFICMHIIVYILGINLGSWSNDDL